MLRPPRLAPALVAALLLAMLQACSGDDEAPSKDPEAAWTTADPKPDPVGEPRPVGASGETFTFDGVTVTVPTDVSTEAVQVQETAPIGRVGDEWFGQPVHVEHSAELTSPVTVAWSTEALTPDQAATAVLARWNADLETWEVSDVVPELRDGKLVAELSDFSFWDVIAGVGQTVGEVTGTRVDPPKCTGRPLPAWVDGTVDPDEDTSAAALRVCFEPDKAERVTVRVANNRTFTQRMVLDGADRWAWTWPGRTGVGIDSSVVDVARSVFDDGTHYLLPPLHELAVGVGRPSTAGAHVVTGTATVDPVTVLVDVVLFVSGQVPVGGLDNPLANAFVQVLYECGGKKLLDDAPSDAAGVVRFVVGAVGSCATEILRADSEFGARFEALVQKQIRAHPGQAAQYAKAYRLVREAARKFAIITVGQVAFYLSDQLANAMVGDLNWLVRGRGRNQGLGDWTPSCSDLAEDSNLLYKNLALQDEFSDTSTELHDFPGWSDAAVEAVAPLADCDPAYGADLASYLPTSWGDPEAAEVVADAIRGLLNTPSSDAVPGDETARVTFDHPTWGEVTMVTSMDVENNRGYITVLDTAGTVVWDYDTLDSVWYEMELNDPAIDATGNIFVNWNPGRYNGVSVLRPVEDGFADFDTLPPEGDYAAPFYYAEVTDADGDDVFDIEAFENDCDPSCAGGTITSQVFFWTGSGYETR